VTAQKLADSTQHHSHDDCVGDEGEHAEYAFRDIDVHGDYNDGGSYAVQQLGDRNCAGQTDVGAVIRASVVVGPGVVGDVGVAPIRAETS
jgi:hypothetical protein